MTAPEGICRICGTFGKLSFEHIPPRSTFNDRAVRRLGIEDGLNNDLSAKGKESQRGLGAYTICGQCNNDTGHWYGTHFAEFVYQAAYLLQLSGGKPTLYYPYYLSPLSVIKQIVCMFFSIKGPEFARENPELVSFVLNPEKRYLHPKYSFGIFYQVGQRFRGLGNAGKITVDMDRFEAVGSSIFSEFAYFPFGYTLTIDSPQPDERIIDISHFARFPYKQYAVSQLRIPVMPLDSFVPGDYGNLSRVRLK